jgi:hypothetical protein
VRQQRHQVAGISSLSSRDAACPDLGPSARLAPQGAVGLPVPAAVQPVPPGTTVYQNPCDNFLHSFKGVPWRAGPDGLGVEHERRARPTVGEMSGQSGPP